ncbi:hypothetical protein [Bacillus sp. B1-b2]|uniref:hypothetical protein n=1 Tax=Bacillus sp. B1-b2 TaxID=2653201 RepID=UPI001261DF12|nr:hypothetical protein [Bacillus sp. B1-b2]KAB7661947.1 hypothetical protein F9279_24780 [Bacillus sp. B1-b2]
MINQKVYIILTDTGTLFTRCIKLFTRKPHNHASISLDANLGQVYSFGRKKPNNPFIGGFIKEDIHHDFYRKSKCVIYSITVTEEQYEKIMEKIKKMEEDKRHYRYNLIGLLFILFRIPYNRKNAYFCSQFVASILNESGVIYFEKPLSLMTPYDLLDDYKMQRIYEGNLQGYPISMSNIVA